MMVLVFFTTILNASHFRSIRVGSFLNKGDAQKSLVKLDKYMQTHQNIINLQKEINFKAKVIKVGNYYMNVIEPFVDKKSELQEILDTLRAKYPHVYVKRIKGVVPVLKKREIKEEKIEVLSDPIIEIIDIPVVVESSKKIEELQKDEEAIVEEIEEEKIEEEIAVVEVEEEKIEEEEEVAVVEVEEVKVEEEVAVVEVEEEKIEEKEVAVVEVEEEKIEEKEVAVVEVEEEKIEEKEVAVVEVEEEKIEEKEVAVAKVVKKETELITLNESILLGVASFLFFIIIVLIILLLKSKRKSKKLELLVDDNEELETLKLEYENKINDLLVHNTTTIEELNIKNKEKISNFKVIYENKIKTIKKTYESKIEELTVVTSQEIVTPEVQEEPKEKIVNSNTELEELSISIGIANCDGDLNLFNTVLGEFTSKYENSPSVFEELCTNNEFEKARYLAIDIKDLAVNIGAYALCESVASMEYELERDFHSNWKILVEKYRESLERLLVDINSYTNKN